MTSNINEDKQLKPTWSTQDWTSLFIWLSSPYLTWSRLGWMKAMFVNKLCEHNTSIPEGQRPCLKLQIQSPHWHRWLLKKTSLYILLPYPNSHTFHWNLMKSTGIIETVGFWVVTLVLWVGRCASICKVEVCKFRNRLDTTGKLEGGWSWHLRRWGNERNPIQVRGKKWTKMDNMVLIRSTMLYCHKFVE